MLDQAKQLRAIAQAEFIEIRQLSPSKFAILSSRKLMVLPDRFMQNFGGAAAIYRWTCICPKLLEAPPEIRRALLAHEWGHVAKGHCLATMSALGLTLLYAVLTATMTGGYFWPSVNIVLLIVIGTLLLWALHPKREFEADAIAAGVVGAKNVANSLRWMCDCMRDGKSNENVQARIRTLDGMANVKDQDN